MLKYTYSTSFVRLGSGKAGYVRMRNITSIWKECDVFSPYFFLPLIITIYFASSVFDFYRFEYFNLQYNIAPVIVTGVLSYYIGVYVADRFNWKLPSFGLGSMMGGKTKYFLYILGIIGFISYLWMIVDGQIGIADESIRRNLDPKLKFLSSLLWFSVLITLSDWFLKRKAGSRKQIVFYAVLLFLLMVLFLVLGYRTPMLIIAFTGLIIYHYKVKRLPLKWLLVIMAALALFFILFGLYRFVTEDSSNEFNSREGPDTVLEEEQIERDQYYREKMEEYPYLIRRLNSESVTSHIVLSKLMEYTDQHGFLYGDFHRRILVTVLPGEQTSPRMLTTEMVNTISIEKGKYITRPERTTVPTLYGQLYIEFGYLSVILGFFLYGLVLMMLYNQMRSDRKDAYSTVAFAFITTIFALSIHTGLLDLIFILMIGYTLLSASLERRSETPHNSPTAY
ncbi:oligosaccharide repeat unit polymerase [Virgibacillus sediminis]|uniref:Oligosaccharide repeat unit polymerase n=1 Tax=Virgibacillus sediminis TaxID=202260 RepID=A0ABV7A474_9BACI